MTMLYESFTEPEPHFAQLVPASVLHPIEVYPKADNHDPNAIWAASDARVTRRGNIVEVKLYAIRSYFSPNAIEVHISRLRAKLEPAGIRIRTIRGLGYLVDRLAGTHDVWTT